MSSNRFISFLGLIILLKREQSGNETLDIVYPFFKLRKASVSKRGHIKNPYLKMILTQDHVPTTLFKDEAEVGKNLAWKRNCSISSA